MQKKKSKKISTSTIEKNSTTRYRNNLKRMFSSVHLPTVHFLKGSALVEVKKSLTFKLKSLSFLGQDNGIIRGLVAH